MSLSAQQVLDVAINASIPVGETRLEYLQPSLKCKRKSSNFTDEFEPCNFPSCGREAWCHLSPTPGCRLTRTEIFNNPSLHMTSNRLCIGCLVQRVCCLADNHPLKVSKSAEQCSPDASSAILTDDFNESLNLVFKKQVNSTGLCRLIGYRDDDDTDTHGVKGVILNMKTLWSKKYLTNKENFPLMSCFGAPGQGKTELCRQLTYLDTIPLDDVEEFKCIHISFGQDTAYDHDKEKNTSALHKFVWRALYSLTSDKRWKYYKNHIPVDSFDDFSSFIREKSQIKDSKRVAILFAVDEIMILPDEERNKLLDKLSTFQQDELRNGLPSFVLVTSLYHHQVISHVTSTSKRPIQKIYLPYLAEKSYDDVANIITTDLVQSITQDNLKGIMNEGQLHRSLRIAVSMSGMRFRDLESILKSFYRDFFSISAHKESKSVLTLSGEYLPGPSDKIVDPKDSKLNADLKNALLSPAFTCDLSLSEYYFSLVVEIFLRIIYNPLGSIAETPDIRYLQDEGIIMMKSRISEFQSLYNFIPRINLGFLHLYASQTASSRQEFLSRSLQSFVSLHEKESGSFLFCSDSRKLKEHTILMINNILCAVYSSSLDLIENFEDIMVLVELLRAYTISSHSPILCPDLVDILPGCKFHPWGSESLKISSFIMSEDFILSKQVDMTKRNEGDTISMTMIRQSLEQEKRAMITQPPSGNSETIEYVASHFSSYANDEETPVKLLCSVKLRQSDSTPAIFLLEEIHKLAKRSGLNEGSYYAVLYCCDSVALNSSELPKGSIVVGKDSFFRVLDPFGASCALDLVERKS